MAARYRVIHWWFGIYDGAFQAKTSQIAFEDYTARTPTQSIVIDEEKIVLTWTHFTQNTSYEIWRSNAPYFEPGDSSAVLLDTIEPLPGEGTITFIDEGAGSDSAMYFYVIRALNANSRADTKPVGKIIFELVPGN